MHQENYSVIKGGVVRAGLAFLSLALAGLGIAALCDQKGSGHKSQVEIARMSPEEHVQAYCTEFAHHGLWDRDYIELLDDSITRDGVKAVPAMVKVINEFDPTNFRTSGSERDQASYAAAILLGGLDTGSFRLRAFEEGKVAVDAVRRVAERMRAAHYDTAPDEGERSKRLRYEITLGIVKDLQGTNNYDRTIQDTLELKYKIKLSDTDLLDFSIYLISQDPHYPSWSELDWYIDHNNINDAGNPAQHRIIQNIEPFYKAYLKFKAKNQ